MQISSLFESQIQSMNHHQHQTLTSTKKNRLSIQFFLFALCICIGQFVFIGFATTSATTGLRSSSSSRSISSSSISSNSISSSISSDITTIDQNEAANINHHRRLEDMIDKGGIQYDIVKENDYIYQERVNDSWDSAPIVIESHKLIFFTIPKVGCTVWKQLFRRMNNSTDYMSQDEALYLPHNPSTNGLKYLYNYTTEQASIMMTSPEWTRAIMIRDPKKRFLSSYIDKAIENGSKHIRSKCCIDDESCVSKASSSIIGFLSLTETCKDDHWRPQNDRVDEKYWPYIDNILHLENAQDDAQELLQKVGAWDEYGSNGWGTIVSNKKTGDTKNRSIFEGNQDSGTHTRHSNDQVWKYYTPDSELSVESAYRDDYNNPLFHFTRGDCLTCVDRTYMDIIKQQRQRS